MDAAADPYMEVERYLTMVGTNGREDVRMQRIGRSR
jgi:hypothetical protein